MRKVASIKSWVEDYDAVAEAVEDLQLMPEFVAAELATEAEMEEQYAKTMSADAFSMTTPMFLNGDGKLCMVARIYAMAGASYYDYILEVA